MKLGWKYPDRKKYLDDLSKAAGGPSRNIYFQGKPQELVLHRIPISLPKYRLNNGRTYAAQAEYLSINDDVPKDIFTRDPESEEAIKTQHELLKNLIDQKDLRRYFQTHRQEEPLILTFDGFVLNGNRRLCAMRELLREDERKYKRFENIDVLILPKATERELDELEARLQIHQDIKAPYSWVTFALMLRRRQEEHGYTAKQLAELYEKKRAEIISHLDWLTDAEAYLDFIGKPGAYHLVEKDRYGFEQLSKSRKKLKNEPDRELLEKVSFSYIENPTSGRTYKVIPQMSNHISRIREELIEEFDFLEDSESPSESDDMNLLSHGDESTEIAPVLDAFSEGKNRGKIIEIATYVIEEEELKKKEKKRRTYVVDRLRAANSALSDAVVGMKADSKREGAGVQLDEIDKKIVKIRAWLNE